MPDADREASARVGLCATCTHCRVIRARRSAFYLCQRSFTDARFPRYPRLPVVRCIGYTPGAPSNDDSAGGGAPAGS
jgi:hypothetical protein